MANEAQKNTQTVEEVVATVNTEDLANMIVTQGEVIAEQQAEIEKLKAQVIDLKSSAAVRRAAPAGPAGTFKIGSKEYRVMHGLMLRRDGALVKVSAEEILNDKVLRESLVKKGSNAVQAV